MDSVYLYKNAPEKTYEDNEKWLIPIDAARMLGKSKSWLIANEVNFGLDIKCLNKGRFHKTRFYRESEILIIKSKLVAAEIARANVKI